MKKYLKSNSGFTLIELLIVIVIIGILAAIAIPNLIGLIGGADRGAVTSDMRTLMTEIESSRARTPGSGFSPDAIRATNAWGNLTAAAGDFSPLTFGADQTDYVITFSGDADDYGDDFNITISAARGFEETD